MGTLCGKFLGVQAFDCHTAQDTCLNDCECSSLGPNAYCAYDPVVGHWTCGNAHCAG